jgi:hypothetical protein
MTDKNITLQIELGPLLAMAFGKLLSELFPEKEEAVSGKEAFERIMRARESVTKTVEVETTLSDGTTAELKLGVAQTEPPEPFVVHADRVEIGRADIDALKIETRQIIADGDYALNERIDILENRLMDLEAAYHGHIVTLTAQTPLRRDDAVSLHIENLLGREYETFADAKRAFFDATTFLPTEAEEFFLKTRVRKK